MVDTMFGTMVDRMVDLQCFSCNGWGAPPVMKRLGSKLKENRPWDGPWAKNMKVRPRLTASLVCHLFETSVANALHYTPVASSKRPWMTPLKKRSYLVDHVAIEEPHSLGAVDTQKPGPVATEADRELREAYRSYQVGYLCISRLEDFSTGVHRIVSSHCFKKLVSLRRGNYCS